MTPALTVFTPTYNRALTLVRTYESLCRQTSKDFEWIIVDDGSSDITEELAFKWIAQAKIHIRYIKKENGGLHTGYNTAIANARGVLNVCIDSDDYMPDDAVENIINEWETIKENSNVAGIIGLDYLLDDRPLGGLFKEEKIDHFHSFFSYHPQDTKLVVRNDLLKSIPPMKSFPGEKNYNPAHFYWIVDKDYKFKIVNKNFCYVDYQPTGMSSGIYKQYRNSPHSFAELRRVLMSLDYRPLKLHFRNAIHYVSSCIFGKEWDFIHTSPRPFLTFMSIPFGVMLNLYIRYKTYK